MSDRHQFRANWHDYNEGLYFVTICCNKNQRLLGKISCGTMSLNKCGEIAYNQIISLAQHFSNVERGNFVIMPNHIHLIIRIKPTNTVGTLFKASASNNQNLNLGCLKSQNHNAPVFQDFHHNSQLSIVVRCLKGGITREIRKLGITFSWQERFYEHVIRNQHSYNNIVNYIETNVVNWQYDCFNEDRICDLKSRLTIT